MRRNQAAIALCAILASLAWSVPTGAQIEKPLAREPQACDDPTDSISLFAERLKDGRIGYGRTPGTARIPGPTLQMTEGDCIQVTLVNDTNKRLSMHAHGVDYTPASDGTPMNDGCVAPGRSKTYVFEAHLPATRADGTVDGGSAGYWHYHDHCMWTPHGTEGVSRGLFGALIVRRAGDPVPANDPFVVVMSGSQINLRSAPKTPIFKANEGERVEFVVIGHGNLMHTFHLHGHRWADNRTGTVTSPSDSVAHIDNKTLGPADSFGFQLIAGEGVGPGAWMYHCHVQEHSDAGMSGLFVVRTPGGEVNDQTRRAIRKWKREHRGH
jgi:FtsP/CotA-like multicopper oxidase with cupredoxin domain